MFQGLLFRSKLSSIHQLLVNAFCYHIIHGNNIYIYIKLANTLNTRQLNKYKLFLSFSGDAHADYCMHRDQLNSPFYVWVLTSFNNFFLVVNSSINFVVYCFVGRGFRNTLIGLFKKSSSNAKYITHLTATASEVSTQGRMQSLDSGPSSFRRPSFVRSLQQINELTYNENNSSKPKSAVSSPLKIHSLEISILSSSDDSRFHKQSASFV